MHHSNSFKICLKFLIFLSIMSWIYFWFILFWAIPILITPDVKLSDIGCLHIPNTNDVVTFISVDQVDFFTPLGISLSISKLIQSPITLVFAIALTLLWFCLLIKHSKDENLTVFMPLFTVPLVLTLFEHVLTILLATDLAKSLISIITLVSH